MRELNTVFANNSPEVKLRFGRKKVARTFELHVLNILNACALVQVFVFRTKDIWLATTRTWPKIILQQQRVNGISPGCQDLFSALLS